MLIRPIPRRLPAASTLSPYSSDSSLNAPFVLDTDDTVSAFTRTKINETPNSDSERNSNNSTPNIDLNPTPVNDTPQRLTPSIQESLRRLPFTSSMTGKIENVAAMGKQLLKSYWGETPQIEPLCDLLKSWSRDKQFSAYPREKPLEDKEARVVNYARKDLVLLLKDLHVLAHEYIVKTSINIKNNFIALFASASWDTEITFPYASTFDIMDQMPQLMKQIDELLQELYKTDLDYVCITSLRKEPVMIEVDDAKESQPTPMDMVLSDILEASDHCEDYISKDDSRYLILQGISTTSCIPTFYKLQCWKQYSELYLSSLIIVKKSSRLAFFSCFTTPTLDEEPYISKFFKLIKALDLNITENLQAISFKRALLMIAPKVCFLEEKEGLYF